MLSSTSVEQQLIVYKFWSLFCGKTLYRWTLSCLFPQYLISYLLQSRTGGAILQWEWTASTLRPLPLPSRSHPQYLTSFTSHLPCSWKGDFIGLGEAWQLYWLRMELCGRLSGGWARSILDEDIIRSFLNPCFLHLTYYIKGKQLAGNYLERWSL